MSEVEPVVAQPAPETPVAAVAESPIEVNAEQQVEPTEQVAVAEETVEQAEPVAKAEEPSPEVPAIKLPKYRLKHGASELVIEAPNELEARALFNDSRKVWPPPREVKCELVSEPAVE